MFVSMADTFLNTSSSDSSSSDEMYPHAVANSTQDRLSWHSASASLSLETKCWGCLRLPHASAMLAATDLDERLTCKVRDLSSSLGQPLDRSNIRMAVENAS